METPDLELLRDIFQDYRRYIAIGLVTQLGLSNDGVLLRVMVKLMPDQREIVAIMGMADVYDVTFPEINDLVVVAFDDGNPDGAKVIGRLNSSEEPIPVLARAGDSVKYARDGKKLFLGSDTKVGLARPDVEPTEPLVLGNVMVSAMRAFFNAFLNVAQVGISPAGPVFLDPSVRTALTEAMQTYLTDASTNILSQLSYTERGTS